MDKLTLLQFYRKAIKVIGFQENIKKEGWMPKLGPNDFRSVIRHGNYKGKRAVMKVSPHENLLSIVRDYRRYQRGTKGKPVVRIPSILRSGKIRGAQYLVQQSAPGSERILKNYPLSAQTEKEEVARLYWNTVNHFPSFDFGQWAISDYFLERVDKWFTIGRENGAVKFGFISQEEKDKTVRLIFSNLGKLKTEPFFAHFANTDIVKSGKEYYIWDSVIVPKPEAMGIALWIWGATLYAYKLPPTRWLEEVEAWTKTFVRLAPKNRRQNLRLKIKINLRERMLGSLLVDLPLKRSPFHTLSRKETTQATKIVRAVLGSLL